MRRYRSRQLEVEVSVDVGDVLDQLSETDLMDELRARRNGFDPEGFGSDWFDRLRWYINRNDKAGALAMLDSLLPRIRSREAHALGLQAPERPTAH